MATAVQVIFNDSGSKVVGSVDAALAHVADNVLGAKGKPEQLRRLLKEEGEAYEYLSAAGAMPSLAHMLSRAAGAQGRETLALQVHDLDAKPGFVTERMRYDFVEGRDPSFELFLHIARACEDEEDRDEMREELYSAVSRAVKGIGRFGWDDAEKLAALRAQEDAFGYAEGHPFRVVPAAVPGEKPATVLGDIAHGACRKYDAVMDRLDLQDSPPAP